MFQVLTSHPILATMAVCFLAAGLVHETQRQILPLFIPASEIETLAEELMVDFGPLAFEPGEEGKWRRVAREIRRRNKHVKAG
jgi:hypothetical protein